LCYYISGFTLEDVRNMDLRERDWFYGRLIQQFKDEEEQIRKSNEGRL